MPGRVTVHIWSSVRSVKLCRRQICCIGIGMTTHVCRGNDVVAVIATQALPAHFSLFGWTRSVPHDKVTVEPESRIHDDLAFCCADDRRKPSRFSRIHEQEDCVVCSDKLFELSDIRLDGRFGRSGYRMSGHRDQ